MPTSSDLLELLVLILSLLAKLIVAPLPKGHHSSHVSAAILVSGVRGINPPLYSSEVVSSKVEFHVVHAMEVSEDSF